MTFSRVWNTGISDNQPATGAQLTQLDLNVSRSYDGYAGGKYQPSSKLITGGTAGKQIGDVNENTPFITKDAKWLGAALDFAQSDSFTGGQIQDVCMPAEGVVIVVSASTNDNLWMSLDGGKSFAHNITSSSDTFQCTASTPPRDDTKGWVLVGANSATLYYTSQTSNYVTYATTTMPGTPISIDAIHYDSVNNQFIAVGKTAGAPYLATITNAVVGTPTPTQRTVPGAITGSNAGLRIAQNPVTGRMVASWAGQTKVAYSDDGVTWTASTTSLASASYSLSYADGTFLAIDTADGSHIYKSSDGNTWSSASFSAAALLPMNTPKAFSNINGIFFVGYGNGVCFYSLDAAATWHPLFHSPQFPPNKLDVTSCVRSVNGRLFVLQSHSSTAVVSRSRKLGSALAGA